MSIGVGGQFLSIVSEFLSDKRQRVSLDGKVSESVDAVSVSFVILLIWECPRIAFWGRCC